MLNTTYLACINRKNSTLYFSWKTTFFSLTLGMHRKTTIFKGNKEVLCIFVHVEFVLLQVSGHDWLILSYNATLMQIWWGNCVLCSWTSRILIFNMRLWKAYKFQCWIYFDFLICKNLANLNFFLMCKKIASVQKNLLMHKKLLMCKRFSDLQKICYSANCRM